MKKWKKGLALAFAAILATSGLTACSTDRGISDDPNTINVEFFKGSYGVNWAYQLQGKFEALYAEEGYKVNILKPSSDMRNNVAIQQLARGYEETKADMYISGGLDARKVGEQGEYGVLCEEISDIWNMKPIGFDGVEESKTLKEKVADGIYETYIDDYGKIYGIPYMTTTGGMVVNTRKLALYGITTLPKTTDELFEIWETIYFGANGMENSEKTMLFPFTYMPGSENGYTTDWMVCLMAQYDMAQFKEFWSWQTENEDGTVTWWEDGVTKAATNPGTFESLKVFCHAFDINLASYGTSTQTLDQAQAQIMKQNTGAIFMCNGSWYLNDMTLSYGNSLDDITFINFPVISALADKLWADTVADETKREEMLRYAVEQVDDLDKTDDAQAIATDMTTKYQTTVTKEDIEEVRRARYVYSNRTTGHEIVLTKGLPQNKKDICYKFMRMLASDDTTQLISEYANANSAYIRSPNTTSKYEFVRAASKIACMDYSYAVRNSAGGYKYVLTRTTSNGFMFGHIAGTITTTQNALSMYDGYGGKSGLTEEIYADFAQSLIDKEIGLCEDGFETWTMNNAENIVKYKALWADKITNK